MVLNTLSLSEHLQRESTRHHTTSWANNKNKHVQQVDDDDHTETTFSIDDSFAAFHDDSLKSNFTSSTTHTAMPTVAEGNGFEKVPMRWLSTTSLQKKTSYKIEQVEVVEWEKEYYEEDDEEEFEEDMTEMEDDDDDDYEYDMRDLLKDSGRAMSDCSFKPQESMDSVGWEDFMRQSGRAMSDCSFKPQESMGSIANWGSMRDLSIQEGTCKRYNDRHHHQPKDMSDSGVFSKLSDSCDSFFQDSTFARNVEYLQHEAKKITNNAHTYTFMRNLGTLSSMIMGH